MSLFFKHQYIDYEIGVWKIEESEEDLYASLPDDCRNKAASFKSATRRKEYLAVRRLFKEMFGEYRTIDYLPTGKPFLQNGFIGISHTKGYASVIYSREYEVGIDIEYISDRIRKISSYFLNDDEEKLFDDVPSLLKAWCAKETLYKMINAESQSVDLKHDLHLKTFDSEHIEAYETVTKQQNAYTLHYNQATDFIMVWGIKKL